MRKKSFEFLWGYRTISMKNALYLAGFRSFMGNFSKTITEVKKRWQQFVPTPKRKIFALFSLLTLFVSFGINQFFSTYADRVQSNKVTDLFLDLLPVTDVNFIFFWIAFLWCIGLFFYHLLYPQQLAFLLWSYALFITTRALFISLTHVGPPDNLAVIPPELKVYAFEADMFFSGHVGGPFLFAMLTNNRTWKWVAIGYTALTLFVVLLGHMHYSIDVFAALFISHSLSVSLKKMKPWFDQKFFGGYVEY